MCAAADTIAGCPGSPPRPQAVLEQVLQANWGLPPYCPALQVLQQVTTGTGCCALWQLLQEPRACSSKVLQENLHASTAWQAWGIPAHALPHAVLLGYERHQMCMLMHRRSLRHRMLPWFVLVLHAVCWTPSVAARLPVLAAC